MGKSGRDDPWEYSLRKYLLLLATLVATVTYSAGFNPPGGVWQDTDKAAGHLAGDPIIRDTNYHRYLAFFYCNATAFASSLVVIVLILILSVQHDKENKSPAPLRTLRLVMVMDLLSLMGAYAAGSCRDGLLKVYTVVLVSFVVGYVASNMACWSKTKKNDTEMERPRKVLMLLATFAVSVTYLGGLSAPGGFWDHGAAAGHAILRGGRHETRLKVFFISNTTAFVASLLIIVLLLDKKLSKANKFQSYQLHAFIFVALSGLIAAYSAGSCREVDTTIYVNALIGAVLVTILVQVVTVRCFGEAIMASSAWTRLERGCQALSDWLRQKRPSCFRQDSESTSNGRNGSDEQQRTQQALEKARSLVLLLATLAAAITYQAGLDPPGGLWEEDGDGYRAGDPVLLTRNPRRYKAFYYCNSVAFVASLVAIILVRRKTLHRHNALEAAMILDLFGLIGAYAAGSCRDVATSIYAMALAGAVLVYVVIHVVFFTLDHEDDDDGGDTRGGAGNNSDEASRNRRKQENELVEKRRKRLLLFAILAATITYQAGLTPPSGFRLQDDQSGHRAGDPVLLYNYPRRYKAFFYCNSVSFMLSIALIILLVNKNLYRPAIRSNALSVCTAAGMFGLVGAYAAGSTQHIKTSIYIFALAGVVLVTVALMVLAFRVIYKKQQGQQQDQQSSAPAMENGPSADEENGTDPNADGAGESNGDAFVWPCCFLIKQCCGPFCKNGDAAGEENGEAAAEENGADPNADAAGDENGSSTNPEAAGTDAAAAAAAEEKIQKKRHAQRKNLMLLGILVASVTYQAGLDPPGGVWQSDGAGHTAGIPIMHDNRHPRYLAFFYSNSTSFVASVVVIILLLPESLQKQGWWLTVMNMTIRLDLIGLLIAYAAGSSRSWKTSGYVTALVIAVLGYFVIHVTLSCFTRSRCCKKNNNNSAVASSSPPSSHQSNGQGGELQA